MQTGCSSYPQVRGARGPGLVLPLKGGLPQRNAAPLHPKPRQGSRAGVASRAAGPHLHCVLAPSRPSLFGILPGSRTISSAGPRLPLLGGRHRLRRRTWRLSLVQLLVGARSVPQEATGAARLYKSVVLRGLHRPLWRLHSVDRPMLARRDVAEIGRGLPNGCALSLRC